MAPNETRLPRFLIFKSAEFAPAFEFLWVGEASSKTIEVVGADEGRSFGSESSDWM